MKKFNLAAVFTSLLLLLTWVALATKKMAMTPNWFISSEHFITRNLSVRAHIGNFKPAAYPGGKEALQQYLENSVLLPEVAFQNFEQSEWIGLSATLILTIDTQGQASLDAENSFKSLEVVPDKPTVRLAVQKILVRAIKSMPKWEPATENSKFISSQDSVRYSVGSPPVAYAEYIKSTKVNLAKPNISISSAELKTKDGQLVYAFIQKPPTFPGGLNALKEYLEKNSAFTTGPFNNSPSQSVIVQVILNNTGTVEDVLIAKSLGAQADAQAIKVMKAMPQWNPAKQGDKFISSVTTLFLRYK